MANDRKEKAIREVEMMRERIARERAELKALRERFRSAFDKPALASPDPSTPGPKLQN